MKTKLHIKNSRLKTLILFFCNLHLTCFWMSCKILKIQMILKSHTWSCWAVLGIASLWFRWASHTSSSTIGRCWVVAQTCSSLCSTSTSLAASAPSCPGTPVSIDCNFRDQMSGYLLEWNFGRSWLRTR